MKANARNQKKATNPALLVAAVAKVPALGVGVGYVNALFDS